MRGGTDTFLLELRRLLTQLSEQALILDPQTAQQFKAFAGQVIEIHCQEPELTWHLVLAEDHVDFCAGPGSTPNVAISGSPQGLLQTLLTGHSTDPVEINGDATVLMQLQALTSAFNPDLVKPLANVIGNDKAQRTAAWLELGASTLSELFSSSTRQAQQKAQSYMATRYSTEPEAGQLHDRIDQLRLRVDRLQARLNLHKHPGVED
jgi:ubiquinone biosynthesis protein UbiJ